MTLDYRIYQILFWVIIFAVYILPALLVGFLAASKGRSIIVWLLITFFTGVLGVVILALLPPTAAKRRGRAAEAPNALKTGS